MTQYQIADRIESRDVEREEDVRQPRLVQRGLLQQDGRADAALHAAVRDLAHQRLGGARHRAAHRRQDHPAERQLHRPREPQVGAAQGQELNDGRCTNRI